MEKFFDEQPLTDQEVSEGLKAAFLGGSFIPVFCGSASTGVGVKTLLTFLTDVFPNPLAGNGLLVAGDEAKKRKPNSGAPFSAFVYKTFSDDFAGRLTFFKVMGGTMTPAVPIHNNQKNKGEKVAHLLTACGKKTEEVAHINAGDIGVVAKLAYTETNETLADPKEEVQYAATKFPQRPMVIAIQAKSSTDEDKVGMGLHAMIEQDPTLKVERDSELKQTLLSGMGDQHLDVAVARLRAKTKVEVEKLPPRVRYRETLTRKAEGSFRHKKQSGGRGQFAEVHIRLSPLAEGEFEFKWSVFGGAVPTNYQAAVEKGIVLSMERGVISGNRVVGVLADCFDGKDHPVDSSDMAFQIASSQAFRQVAQEAGPIILEPICNVTTTVPEANMGDVMSDVSQRRGRILGTDSAGKKVIVRAQIPEAEMLTYGQTLRSISGGRGVVEREFSHYDPVPMEIQKKIVEQAEKDKAEEQ
jgi:elongation factor G